MLKCSSRNNNNYSGSRDVPCFSPKGDLKQRVVHPPNSWGEFGLAIYAVHPYSQLSRPTLSGQHIFMECGLPRILTGTVVSERYVAIPGRATSRSPSPMSLGSTQESPGDPRRAQESPGEPRRAQDSPGEPRRAQESPGEPRGASGVIWGIWETYGKHLGGRAGASGGIFCVCAAMIRFDLCGERKHLGGICAPLGPRLPQKENI